MRIVSLASGSGGNAYIIESSARALMIDCGIAYAELVRRAQKASVDLDKLEGVLFTHEHIDHAKGARILRKRHPDLAFYANLMTAEAIGGDFFAFENNQPFEAGPFEIMAFPIPHDVCDPVGYLIRAEGKTYFHATDVGAPLDSIGKNLAKADMATLESNHDRILLSRSSRPESLKRRIRGDRGHLANDEAAGLVAKFASPKLGYLALAHLSHECNTPHLAERAMREALDEIGRADIKLEILSQEEPSGGWTC